MTRDQELRCRGCNRTPAEARTPVSPQATAFTCSRCLMGHPERAARVSGDDPEMPQERKISSRQGGSSGRPSRAPKAANDSGAFRGMLRNVGGRPRKAARDRFARSRDRRLATLTPGARHARRRQEVARVTAARSTRRAVATLAKRGRPTRLSVEIAASV
jgi:hypothetical protein